MSVVALRPYKTRCSNKLMYNLWCLELVFNCIIYCSCRVEHSWRVILTSSENIKAIMICVVFNFLFQVIFVFLLFLGMVMYSNEDSWNNGKTKITKDEKLTSTYVSVIMHVNVLSDMFFARKEKISTRNKSAYGNKTLPKNNSSFTEKSSIYESGKLGFSQKV